MSKFRSIILIIGLLIITVAAALLTVLILYATGTIKTDPIELVYEVGSDSKYYDGTPLTLAEDDYALVSGEILEGHTAQVKIIGSQTNAGESEATLEVKIFDKKGFDVSGEYAVKVDVGTLRVEQRVISVKIPNSSVPYSGKRVYFDKYELQEGELAKGHKIGGVNASLLNVNDPVPENITPVIYDAFDNDVTENYKIEGFEVGDIEITPRPLTIRPKNITKVYDGIEFEATEYEIIGGSLAEGQIVECTIQKDGGGKPLFERCTGEYGERIEFGDFKIYDGGEEVALSNYKPALNNNLLESGVVIITPRPITVVTATETFTYDGEAHYNDTVEFLSGTLAPNQTYLVTEPTTVTNAGEEEDNAITLKIYGNGQDVSNNYLPTYITGKLTVKKCDLTVYTKSYIKEYDKEKTIGDHMAADETNYELSVKLPEKFKITTSCAATVTTQKDFIEATSYKLTVEIYLNDDKCSDNFNINVREGKYGITSKPITIPLNQNLQKVYDGKGYEFNKTEVFANSKLGDYDLTVADFNLVYLDIKSAGTYHYTAEYNGTSENYAITVGTGTVKITRKTVDLVWDNAYVEMTYSGYENYYSNDSYLVQHLTVDEHEVSSAVFIKANYDLKHIRVKSVIVYDKEEGDLTQNYNIDCTKVDIQVTVNPCKLTLVLPEYSDDYYRSELIAAGVSAMGLAAGDELVVSASDITNDGNSTYYVTDCTILHNGENVTDYYAIDFGEGGKYFVPD